MKITLERLREIITEEVIKESVSPEDAQRTIVALLQGTPPNVTGDIMGAVYDEMYDADVSEPSAEPEEEEMRRAIRSPGQKEAEKVPVDAPEQKTIGGLHRGIEEVIQEEYYIYLIEQELKKGTLTEAKEELFRRVNKADLIAKAQKDRNSKEAKVWLGGASPPKNWEPLTVTTDVSRLRDAEKKGLAQAVYQMSHPGRQYLFDQGGSISNVQPEQLAAQDERYREQNDPKRTKIPITREPVRTYKTPSDQPASTSGGLDWFLGRWRDFIKSASPEQFRAEVDRSKEYLPDGKSIIEYLEAFLSMLRNRYQHDYQTV